MTDATEFSNLEFSNLELCNPRSRPPFAGAIRSVNGEPQATSAAQGRRSAPRRGTGRDTGAAVLRSPRSAIEGHSPQPSELDHLHLSLAKMMPEHHPRTARLLASSTRKIAQKVIEEAGEVALEAVKHRAHGVVRESADLLYHLVVLWRHAGIDPEEVWTEMRCRADMLGIAEKRPKARSSGLRTASITRSPKAERK